MKCIELKRRPSPNERIQQREIRKSLESSK
jgi:hypothetical protein